MSKINPNDFLQPTDPRFKKVYGYDPFEESEKQKKENDIKKENYKAKLEEDHWRREKGRLYPKEYLKKGETPLRTEERKTIDKIVLN